MDAIALLGPIVVFLFSLLPLILAVVVLVVWLKLSKERNMYLKEIAEELRRRP